MNEILRKIGMIMGDASLRMKVLFTVGALAIFRLLASVPIPGVDKEKLNALLTGNGGQFFGLLNIFSGGTMSNLSIVMLGVGPYITGSIIMQLLTIMSPKLKAMYQEEGEVGRMKFTQYSRMLTVPMAIVQAFGFISLLKTGGVLAALSPFALAVNIIVIVAGSVLLMWIGELITEFGIGNGVSLMIFAGIVAVLPTKINQFIATFNTASIPLYLAFAVGALAIIYLVVMITEAERPIPVTYAKRVRGMKVYGGISTYLPLRLNQAGVIPIIFALSILLFPQMILKFLSQLANPTIVKISDVLSSIINNNWIYAGLYFVLVFVFTYFYTAVTFDPDSISDNLQKSGAFIPGVRPGKSTSDFIAKILTRLTLVGALFLGVIAVLPLAMRAITEINTLAIGGTALLIVVSVVIDLIKKIEAQITIREY